MTVEGNTTGGANVTFTDPTATDIVWGETTVTCLPASGNSFPLGQTTVNCSTMDGTGNPASTSFDVTVEDTTDPTLVDMPSDAMVEGNTAGGAFYAYTDPTATDIVDPNPVVDCAPGSGFFPLGTTTVTCTATDGSGNVAEESFDVTVVDTTDPVITYVDRRPRPMATAGTTAPSP